MKGTQCCKAHYWHLGLALGLHSMALSWFTVELTGARTLKIGKKISRLQEDARQEPKEFVLTFVDNEPCQTTSGLWSQPGFSIFSSQSGRLHFHDSFAMPAYTSSFPITGGAADAPCRYRLCDWPKSVQHRESIGDSRNMLCISYIYIYYSAIKYYVYNSLTYWITEHIYIYILIIYTYHCP